MSSKQDSTKSVSNPGYLVSIVPRTKLERIIFSLWRFSSKVPFKDVQVSGLGLARLYSFLFYIRTIEKVD